MTGASDEFFDFTGVMGAIRNSAGAFGGVLAPIVTGAHYDAMHSFMIALVAAGIMLAPPPSDTYRATRDRADRCLEKGCDAPTRTDHAVRVIEEAELRKEIRTGSCRGPLVKA
jgi:hypothetical protein